MLSKQRNACVFEVDSPVYYTKLRNLKLEAHLWTLARDPSYRVLG